MVRARGAACRSIRGYSGGGRRRICVRAGHVGTDLWCHVLSGPPRAADRRVVDALPVDRIVVVLTKADVYGPVPDPGPVPVFAPDAVVTAGAVPVNWTVRCIRCRRCGRSPIRAGLSWNCWRRWPPRVRPFRNLRVTSPPQQVRDIGPGDEEKLRIGLLRSMDRWGCRVGDAENWPPGGSVPTSRRSRDCCTPRADWVRWLG